MNLGPHELSVAGDLLTVRWRGVPSLAEMQVTLSHADQVIRSEGFVFVLCDMRQARPTGAETRRYMQQWLGRHTSLAIVCFGISMPVRVVMLLIARAMVLLGQQVPAYTLFASEAEARAWIDGRRPPAQHSSAPSSHSDK